MLARHRLDMKVANGARGPLSRWVRRRHRRCIEIVRRREAAKLMATERVQRFAVSTGEIITDDDRQVERLGHTFDPADQIDGGTDYGEIEPVGGTDIAVDRRADVKRDNDLKRRFTDD
jgi:hypothetical protein